MLQAKRVPFEGLEVQIWEGGEGFPVLMIHGVGPGTQDWIGLPSYPLMWSQIIRAFLPDTAGPGLNVMLRRAGDDLTRANIMKVAASLQGYAPDTLLPGITVTTAADDFHPIEQLRLMRFSGDRWELFGPVIDGELRN